MFIEEILELLPEVKPGASGWTAHCPAHDDRNPSLHVAEGEAGRVLIKCFAGCSADQITKALDITMRDLFPENPGKRGGGEGEALEAMGATVQPARPCSLAEYAAAKGLPEDFLRGLGLEDVHYGGAPAVKIPYLMANGHESAVRFRTAIDRTPGIDRRFRWRNGSKPMLYGLWRVERARAAEQVVLVEGESDCHTLWYYDIPALGLPGATTWNDGWAQYLEGIPRIYAIIEPDQGGETLRKRLAGSSLRDRIRWVVLGETKDPSGLHLSAPDQFVERFQKALDSAITCTQEAHAEAEAVAREAWARCEPLARERSILDRFAETLAECGVAGQSREAKLLYLAVTSRLLARPVSCVLKGPSSAGKSFLTDNVLKFFPPSAYYVLSGMSERVLAYSTEPLAHRFLVIYEAAGLGEFATYLLRSFLSEGRVRYETVESTSEGLRPRVIEREGPTGLLVTTTKAALHAENETRLFSVPISDGPEQTRAILRETARQDTRSLPDLAPWHALQAWLEVGERRVVIPFAERLAELMPARPIRLRRDFPAVLSVIRAHALLHQASRNRHSDGGIVADYDDYAVVRGLLGDLLAVGVEASVPTLVRETVDSVGMLTRGNNSAARVTDVATALGLDKGSASRRIDTACALGYLRKLESRPGRRSEVIKGVPLPENFGILPPVEILRAGCAVANRIAEEASPPPSAQPDAGNLLPDMPADLGRMIEVNEGDGVTTTTSHQRGASPFWTDS